LFAAYALDFVIGRISHYWIPDAGASGMERFRQPSPRKLRPRSAEFASDRSGDLQVAL